MVPDDHPPRPDHGHLRRLADRAQRRPGPHVYDEPGQIDFGVYNGPSVISRAPRSPTTTAIGTSSSLPRAPDGMHLYVDGDQVASNPSTAAAGYIGYWQLGGIVNAGWPDSTGTPYTGGLSDARVLHYELTAAQVQNEYSASPLSQGSGGTTTTTKSTTPTTTSTTPPQLSQHTTQQHTQHTQHNNSLSAPRTCPRCSPRVRRRTGGSGTAPARRRRRISRASGNPGNYSATGVTYGVSSPVESATGRGIALDGVSGQVIAAHDEPSPTV